MEKFVTKDFGAEVYDRSTCINDIIEDKVVNSEEREVGTRVVDLPLLYARV